MRTSGQTGVEMEALTAVSVAALTIYDMLKAVDKAMVIGEIRPRTQNGRQIGNLDAHPRLANRAGGRAVKILVAVYSDLGFWTLPEPQVERLRTDFPEHAISAAAGAERVLELIPEADVVLASTLRPAQFAAARRLRWIHSPAAGVGGMLFPELVASPVVLTNSRGLGATTIAEHVLAVTLAMFRGLPRLVADQQARRWAQAEAFGPPGPRAVAGARVLIIGLGAIGDAAARRFVALDAAVTGHSPARPARGRHARRSGRRARPPAAPPARRRRGRHRGSADARDPRPDWRARAGGDAG